MGVALHPAADAVGDLRLEEMVYRTARAALDDAGVARREIDHVTLGGSDEVDARGISSMCSRPCGTAYLKDEMRVTDSGLSALHLGALRAASGDLQLGLVVKLEPELGRAARRHRPDARGAVLPAPGRAQLRHRRRPLRRRAGRAARRHRNGGRRTGARAPGGRCPGEPRGPARPAERGRDRRIAAPRPSAARRAPCAGHRRCRRHGACLGRLGACPSAEAAAGAHRAAPSGRSTATSSTASASSA